MKAVGLTEFGGPESQGHRSARTRARPRRGAHPGARGGGQPRRYHLSVRRAGSAAGRPRCPPHPWHGRSGRGGQGGEDSPGRLAVGDCVIAYIIPFGPHGGSYAEKVVVAAASVVPAPAGASFPRPRHCSSTRPQPGCPWTPSRCHRPRPWPSWAAQAPNADCVVMTCAAPRMGRSGSTASTAGTAAGR
jgi:hypothetical protein